MKYLFKWKKMSFRIIILIIILIFFSNNAFSKENTTLETDCINQQWEDKYKCQIEKFCKWYSPENKNLPYSPSFKTEEYFFPYEKKETKKEDKDILKKALKEKDLFWLAKSTYLENQNNIYACSLLKIQKNSLSLIKKELSQIDKTGEIKWMIDKKIDIKLQKINLLEKKRKCLKTISKNALNNKKYVLYESAYEYCKYSYYLDFLKKYYKRIDIINTKIGLSLESISKILKLREQKIKNEEEHSERVFQIAFETYTSYENNYTIHILLEIIRYDFNIFRQKFHKSIGPINQVVYKIKNAMSK